MHITVKSEHIEKHIDCEDSITRSMEETSFLLLLLDFIAFEHVGIHINEINCLLELVLFCQNFEVQFYEFVVGHKVWFLHQLEQKQICNI